MMNQTLKLIILTILMLSTASNVLAESGHDHEGGHEGEAEGVSPLQVELSPLQLKALDTLYEIGFKHGMWDTPMKTEDYLIPKEYEVLRNS